MGRVESLSEDLKDRPKVRSLFRRQRRCGNDSGSDDDAFTLMSFVVGGGVNSER